MTALQKLRHRRGLLVGVILFALFAFVLTDVITSSDRFSMAGRTTVATIGGKKLDIEQYRAKTNEMMEANKQYNIGYGMASNQVFENWVSETVLEQQYDAAGVTVGREGMLNGILSLSDVRQYFTNALGQVDKNSLLDWARSVRTAMDQGDPQAQQAWAVWSDMKVRGRQQWQAAQYLDMVRAGLNATQLDAKVEYAYQNDQVDGRFAYLPYSSIKDDTVSVSDAEISAYVKKHAKDFEREETRDIQYVVVPVDPSEKDADEVKAKVAALMEDRVEFNKRTNTTDTIPGFPRTANDSVFVNTNTDIGAKYLGAYAKTFANQEESEWVKKARKNDILGPYRDGDSYKLSKLLDVRQMPDSVKVSHVLISYQGNQYVQANRTQAQAQALADSLVTELKKGRLSFADAAKKYSDDPTVQENGGDAGWMPYVGTSPELETFLFFNPKGSVRVVESPMGYHVFRIDDQKGVSTAYKVATITNFISPSRETAALVQNKAQGLAAQNASVEEFVANARKAGYDVIPATDFTILESAFSGLGDQTQITRWAFSDNVKVGDTKVFDVAGDHVVAVLSGMKSAGLETAETARAQVEPILIKEKKAKMLEAKLKSASGTVEEIAAATGAEVLEATSLTIATPIVPGAGRAPKAVGTAFGLKEGQVSAPVADETGVFVATVTARRDAQPAENYESIQNALSASYQQSLLPALLPALREKAEVEDNRVKMEKLYSNN